ncbi:hypothetical protein OG788_46010 [Streptomyces sp. NBC_00647]|uniref:hypothetical protein n=1 Tax=Streptomyces sp. NBC_00647 TaxID=2975796 RepID=UPI00325636A5
MSAASGAPEGLSGGIQPRQDHPAGLFALSLPSLVRRAAWRLYVDTPDDIRLARKILRKKLLELLITLSMVYRRLDQARFQP